MGSSQLSRRGAVLMGLLSIVCGVPPILIGLGVLTPANAEPSTPTWMPMCAGLLFVHSSGGLHVRLYASTHPNDVAGMV